MSAPPAHEPLREPPARRECSLTAFRPHRCAPLVALLACLAGAPAVAEPAPPPATDEAQAGPSSDVEPSGWVFGRSPAVFRDAGDAVATRIGGWVDASYRDNDRRGSSLNLDHVNLFADTRWRQLQGFVEVEWERETVHTGFEAERDVEVEQAWARYHHAEWLDLRIGRFNTPFGYWVPIHWAILMDTIEEPIHVGRDTVPEQQLGVEVAGHWFPGELAGLPAELLWSLYAGHGSDTLHQEDVDGFTVGGDLRLRLAERGLLGASLYRQRSDRPRDLGRSELSSVVYGELGLPWRLTFRTEYVHQYREERPLARYDRDLDVGYAKLRWDLRDDVYLNYRFSWGDDDDETGRTAEVRIHTLTLGFQPLPSLRVKLEVSDHDYRPSDRSDFRFWGISVGYLF